VAQASQAFIEAISIAMYIQLQLNQLNGSLKNLVDLCTPSTRHFSAYYSGYVWYVPFMPFEGY